MMFLLADSDNHYASCERVMRPDLKGRPIIVLSNNDGCVVARSREAKALGIEMGEPWHLSKDRFSSLGCAVFSSNYTLYGDMSRRVRMILDQFAQEIETYSIDEFFLRLESHSDWSQLGHAIRGRVHRDTGISLTCGFGPSKVLAKLATRTAKKNPTLQGVFVTPTGPEREDWLSRFATEDVWGIASQLSTRLQVAGIRTALELSRLEDWQARKLMGVTGARICAELRGLSCLPIEETAADRKSLCCAKSFGRPVHAEAELMEGTAAHAAIIAAKLRAGGLVAAVLQVFVETNPFSSAPKYSSALTAVLPEPTNDSSCLAKTATDLTQRMFKAGFAYKRVGVVALELQPSHAFQLTFEGKDRGVADRRNAAFLAMDKLNLELGRGTVRLASTGKRTPDWALRAQMRSPAYTTRLEDIPLAKA